MIDSDAISGIPAVNLGTSMTAYQPFSVVTSGGSSGTPQNPASNGDVWGVVDVSGRRGILVKRGAVFTGRITFAAFQSIAVGAAIYVASGATVFTNAAAGSQVAVCLEAFSNGASTSTVNLKMMWI